MATIRPSGQKPIPDTFRDRRLPGGIRALLGNVPSVTAFYPEWLLHGIDAHIID